MERKTDGLKMIRKKKDKGEEPGKTGAVLVLGAGIAGMQASLDLADMGFKVYLADEKGWIGGGMAKLDKTFPTNDCAMCIMSPKLVDTGRHQNIEILPLSRVEGIEGEPGRFKVKLTRMAGYIDPERCNGCGDCVETCPVNVIDAFDDGLSERKAIYRLYPQAIPNTFAIDKEGHKPPCRVSCPAGLNVQGYVALISNGEFGRALRLIKERLPFPKSIGRICHHPCEETCNRSEVDEAVAICALKRFVADRADEVEEEEKEFEVEPREERKAAEKEEEEKKNRRKGKKIAVVGAGPAGLTAARDLASMGYSVTVLERESEAGGMMRFGIPAYRLPREVLAEEVADIIGNDIEFITGFELGKDKNIGALSSEFDAVIVATGAHRAKKIDIAGMDKVAVHDGTTILKQIAGGDKVKIGASPIVIGGGNVAIDVARSLKRLGAEHVRIACLESHKNMPAHLWEIKDALDEGIELYTSVGPKKIVLDKGAVKGLECAGCRTTFDEDGRFAPDILPAEEQTIDGDAIVLAVGQEPDLEFLKEELAVEKKKLVVDPVTLATSMEGVFAAGDLVLGPASAVEAIGQGHEAAISIDRFILGEDMTAGREKDEDTAPLPSRRIDKLPRQKMESIDMEKRLSSFAEYEKGYTEEMALAEAKRCLNCGICSECQRCVEVCGRDAIVHDMKDTEQELEVGAVIISTGYHRFDATQKTEYGLGRFPNVVTSTQFERILSASGPYRGHLVRPFDGKEPRRVAFIQCVGSREEKDGNRYCSSVCCMYAMKEAVIAMEHAPGVECHIYFMDLRAFGKDFERYYNRAKEEYGVVFRRVRMPMVEEAAPGGDLVLSYLDEKDNVLKETYDMVVLSVGLEPSENVTKLARKLGITLGEEGFIQTVDYDSQATIREGIYVCGAATEPKDIPETVAQASAASARAAELLSPARGSLVRPKSYPEERDISDEEPRVGVFVCHCGINIGGVVDVPAVTEFARTLPSVAYAEENLYTCSQDTQEKLTKVIQEKKLNRIVIASCTPRTHEQLFQDTLREAGLNPYLFEFAGIREQCSWVHIKLPAEATEKAKQLVEMGVARARQLQPVQLSSFEVTPKALVIGGGPGGMTAALSLAQQGFYTYLVEKEDELGGNLRHIHFDFAGRDPKGLLANLIDKVKKNEMIEIYKSNRVAEVSGYVGNFKTTIRNKKGEETEVEHGAIIVATGAEEYSPTEYLYGESNRVLTQKELEERLAKGETFNNVVMIQCVGSRDDEHPYCSRVCCLNAVKNALKIKEADPRANIYILYRDIRTYGFSEVYYQQVRDAGVVFIRYEEERKPQVFREEDRLKVKVFDYLLGREVEIDAEHVVLSAGIVMPETTEEFSKMLKVPLNADRMFLEAHPKLRPLDFSTDGLYLCGLAHGPKNLRETISQAMGAASRAATLLSQKTIKASARPVSLQERYCSGCGLCVEACPFDARELDPETGKARVIEVLCQGCGACMVACPNASTRQKGFEKAEIMAMIDSAV